MSKGKWFIAAVAVALVTAAAAGASPAVQSVQIGSTHALYLPAAGAHGRVIVLHGLGETATEFVAATGNQPLLQGLTDSGYDVVVPDLPYHSDALTYVQRKNTLKRAILRDGGRGYLKTWDKEFAAVTAWADTTHGALPLTVAGVSWGGYNALEAACRSNRPFAFIAAMPVVYVPWITEYQGLKLPAMSLSSSCIKKIEARHGLLQYGTQDVRVGAANERILAAALQAHGVTVQPFDIGHTTTPETFAAMIGWIASTP